MIRVLPPVVLVLAVSAVSPGAGQQPLVQTAEDLSLQAFIQDLESAVGEGNSQAWLALLSPNADRAAAATFFDEMLPRGITRAVARERDRQPLSGALPGEGFQLIVDVFAESGTRGRIQTWRVDVRRPRETSDRQPWRVVGQERLSSIDGLHRLGVNAAKRFIARNLIVKSVDLEVRLPLGDVFVADTAEGTTAVVMLGDGTMTFRPAPAEERGQVRLFAGSEAIDTPFSAVFLRLNPFDFNQQLQPQLQTPSPDVDVRLLRRASSVFEEESGKSFSLDLRDLSRENWSLLPQPGDFVAEIRTRRFGTLTYARALGQPEDVTLFHRERKRNIAAYASEMKLASRGRFYDEDSLVEYDVLDHQIDATFHPEREWLDGVSRLRVRVKSFALGVLTLKLGDSFTVSSITSDKLGRLMFLRVRNQNDVVVNLPSAVPRDFEMTLTVAYAGRAETQSIDQEGLAIVQGRAGQSRSDELPTVPPEPNWLFSNRTQWYPQNQVTDYATSRVRFTVPADYKAVVSGIEAVDSPVMTLASGVAAPRMTYIYDAVQPVRYIGAIISRFSRADRAGVALDVSGNRNTLTLAVDANRRQMERGRDLVPTAAEIVRLFSSLIGDIPYDELTIAMVEDNRPGGHSPGYFAVLNNPPPITPWVPRHDPAAFNSFPEFYIAHEIAHQWWGQAVGWKNYHEQWLSEGFAQYFAALYAQERRGDGTFRDVLRHLRRWAMDQSDQGAVYLGYRLGHIKGDSRVFRAIVYNKGALVLHMLRRWVGDEVFYRGLRRYYTENKFKKAGTEDLQRAMEAEAGTSLDRFFERWIFASTVPRVRHSSLVEGQQLVIRFEQIGEVFDVPVTVTVQHGDRTEDRIVRLDDAVVEARLPLTGALRGYEVNADHAALGHFERR